MQTSAHDLQSSTDKRPEILQSLLSKLTVNILSNGLVCWKQTWFTIEALLQAGSSWKVGQRWAWTMSHRHVLNSCIRRLLAFQVRRSTRSKSLLWNHRHIPPKRWFGGDKLNHHCMQIHIKHYAFCCIQSPVKTLQRMSLENHKEPA